MNITTEDALGYILEIINSSDRSMPAHFTSRGGRAQSFCLNFEISEKDEYEMASEAWYQARDPNVVKTGEDVMLASYLATKLDADEHVQELTDIIVRHNPQKSDIDTLYIQHCADFGKKIATSSNY